jgi:hypothetical protein
VCREEWPQQVDTTEADGRVGPVWQLSTWLDVILGDQLICECVTATLVTQPGLWGSLSTC